MRKFLITLASACLLTMPVLAEQSYFYDWYDSSADYLGCFGFDLVAQVTAAADYPEIRKDANGGSREDCGLELVKNTSLADGVALGFLATVWNLQEGDQVTASIWRYDPYSGMPYFRLWAHYNDALVQASDARGQDMEAYDGNCQGNNSFGLQNGWEYFEHTWTIEAGHTGLVIDAAIFGDLYATVYVDDFWIWVPDHADVRLPDAVYSSGGEVTPVEAATWTSVKAIFQ
ncbi:MAG TPA: hypothetical protein PLL30_02770 [Candidatus Krumholzibacteria bacterium]|nr:hypothetical protein [Candidatus Krumholzibacteria bacterium]HPD70693.1 hypothetical protein [Candidatus Krumholzibacteria bacterium]HRY39607.1 hypothetical protein [Candidatus Krumholzibacteria bacterium]